MQYRKMGNTGIQVSALGFGMMRLPMMGNVVNEQASIAMLRLAIDNGVNYVDTAYNYLDGNSERVTGLALLDGYRDKVHIATKCPIWLMESPEDFDRKLDEQLARLQTDHIDFYLLHGIKKQFWQDSVVKHGLIRKMAAAKKAGKIRYIGFSFHDNLELFKEVIDNYNNWDFCQIQLNYIDAEFQAGLEGLRYAADRGMGIIIMEPLRGGYLVNVPNNVRKLFAETGKTPVEWALDYLWNLPEVSLLLSGMGTMEQVQENLMYAESSSVAMLSEQEQEIVAKAAEMFKSSKVIPCTGCAYCMHCPKGVAIPYNFAAYNEFQTHGDIEIAKKAYNKNVPLFGTQAKECIGCKICERICPQHIKISKWMPKIHQLLG